MPMATATSLLLERTDKDFTRVKFLPVKRYTCLTIIRAFKNKKSRQQWKRRRKAEEKANIPSTGFNQRGRRHPIGL